MSSPERDLRTDSPAPLECLPSLLVQYEEKRTLLIKEEELIKQEKREIEELAFAGTTVSSIDELAKMKAQEPEINLIYLQTQEQFGQLFSDLRTKLGSDPAEFQPAEENTWIFRKTVIVEGEEISTRIGIIGKTPRDARQARICPEGLNSYLELNSAGGYTMETIQHKLVPHPGTLHDAAFYRKIINGL